MTTSSSNDDPVIRRYSTQSIIDRWQMEYGMDVSRFFEGITEVELRKNPQTALQYFTPASTAGDSLFYSILQQQPWYYLKNKWEHRCALRAIGPARNLLEVGCATGAFLRQFLDGAPAGAKAFGLELNEEAVQTERNAGLQVEAAFVEDFAAKHPGEFDAVCSFEVLEHVPEPESFLAASSALVRPGGILVTAVPNNDSFIGRDHRNHLNMPPHHLNLWTQESLTNFLTRLGYRDIRFLFEPLQPQHVGWYVSSVAERIQALPKPLNTLLFKRPLLKLIDAVLNLGLRQAIRGHTILAIARKEK